ncbi:MAG: bacterial transcriptional activator domain-containing protein [Anaerolineae bacterium]
MKLNGIIEHIYETFKTSIESSRTILLHPKSRYRSVLVARLINAPEYKVFYYALGADDISVPSFLTGITHDLANQNPMFGRHINMLEEEDFAKPETLLKAFIRDLAELSKDDYILILDEYDRSDVADDIQWFVERLAAFLPKNCRMVINSRTLPRLPWVSLIAEGRALLLQDDQLIRRNFYDIQGHGSQTLEVYALGPGFVLRSDKPIDTWEGHLPRLLFFFALVRPVITRSEICQAFWPELDTDQAVNVFHVTKRRLHKALDMDVLVHLDGYYRINPDLDIDYDVMHFASRLMEGRDRNNPDRIAAWQKSIDLYRGPFLQGHNDRWILDRRADFQAGFLEALSQMAQYRLSEGRPEHALGLYLRAVGENPRRQDIHREVMRLYTSLGRRSEAAAHFQKVQQELGKDIEPETRAVYDNIMA